MRYLYSLLAFILLTVSANAADYYYCDTGDDTTGDGSIESPWRSYDKAQLQMDADGSSMYFCEGGTFPTARAVQANFISHVYGSAANRGVIGAYNANGDPIGTLAKPLLTVANGGGGYKGIRLAYIDYLTIRDIAIESDAWIFDYAHQNWGIWIYEDTVDILIDNVSISKLGIATNISNSGSASNGNHTVTIKNSHFEKNWTVAHLGAAKHYNIINNTYDKNGANGGGRPIYLGGGRATSIANWYETVNVLGNTFTNNAPGDVGLGFGDYDGSDDILGKWGCSRGSVIGGHGEWAASGLIRIAGNRIIEVQDASSQCWPISLDEGWPDSDERIPLIIENNYAENIGNMGFGCSNCDGVIVRNNVVNMGENNGAGITINSKDESPVTDDTDPATYPTTTAEVYGNLIIMDSGTQGNPAQGINLLGGDATIAADVHDNLIIRTNDISVDSTCIWYETGSTLANNICIIVDASGDLSISNEFTAR